MDKREVKSTRLQELVTLLNSGSVVVIDVRTVMEYSDGHIWSAINVPGDIILSGIPKLDKSTPIVTVCNMGHGRSEEAASLLFNNGWTNVSWLEGGHLGWVDSGFSDYEPGLTSS